MWLKKILTILIGTIIAIGVCEIILRIYNPLQSRVRGNEIILKSNYKKKITIDPPVNGLDAEVLYSTNSIGFRGPEPPSEDAWDKTKTIITIGGSTTECSLLSDDATWSAQLGKRLTNEDPNTWLNNAGLDGCSTYGHIILMRDYIVKLKPDYALFLVGINDLVKSSFDNEDGFLIERKESFMRKMLKKSELFTLISNLAEAMKSKKANVAHGISPEDYKNNDLNNPDSAFRNELNQKLSSMIPAYVERIAELHRLCDSAGIQSIFMTQPKYDDISSNSWKVMDLYNQALRDYCSKNNLPCIDLASMLPKETQYYYDQIHYTGKGAEKIAELIYPEIKKIIQ